MKTSPYAFTRRAALKTLAVAGTAAAWPRLASAAAIAAPSVRAITDYLQTLARPDGGYAWGDQEITHLTPTLGVIGSYRLLGQTPPNRDALVNYVRKGHPRADGPTNTRPASAQACAKSAFSARKP